MIRNVTLLIGSLFAILPHGAMAAVSISEVAWMGTVESANYEWIELHNDGPAVDVSGWILKDGNTLSIELSGVIPADTYVVLERNRTSGAYLADNPFLIYTGALINTGTTLTLMTSDGSIVDRVADDIESGGWDIGGDNATKDTAQYTSSGWVTGTPTPGRANVTRGNSSDTPSATSTRPAAAGAILRPDKVPSTKLFMVADAALSLRVELPPIVTVGQTVTMKATPSGLGKTVLDSLSWQWNFGDGTATTRAAVVTHVYEFPGTYTVTVRAAFGRHEQIAELPITVVPTLVSITQSSKGDIQVNNDAPFSVDISGYRVVADRSFIFPPRTVMAPKGTITVSHYKVLQERGSDIALYDRGGEVVATLWPKDTEIVAGAEQTDTIESPKVAVPTIPVSQFIFASSAAGMSETNEPTMLVGSEQADTASLTLPEEQRYLPYGLLLLVILIGVAGVVVIRTPNRNGEMRIENDTRVTFFNTEEAGSGGKTK
jgi:PKD repeat protein